MSGRGSGAGSVTTSQQPSGDEGIQTITSTIQVSGDLAGSVPDPNATFQPRQILTINEAIRRGLQYNLGSRAAIQAAKQAAASQQGARSSLLPTISASLSENLDKVDLATSGFDASSFPSIGQYFPSTVGPFHYYSAQANASYSALDAVAIDNYATTKRQAEAATIGSSDVREQVILAVAGTYLRILSDVALVDSESAQVKYSQAVYDQSAAQEEAGAKAHVDVNRILIQFQTERERLAVDDAALIKDKMALARQIGLPIDDDFGVSETLTGDLEPELSLQDAYRRAQTDRNDLRAAELQVRAAQDARRAAGAERLPTLKLQGSYGLQGINPNSGVSVYSGSVQLNIPIFSGGQIRSDEREADAALDQRRSELADLREEVRFEVRSAWIDRDVASSQVALAASNRKLAAETLQQSTDRFFAGATTSVEVVQSEQVVAAAERDYISSLFSLNVAKVKLARAMGEAEKEIPVVLKGAQ
ncbi:MAG: TolC family protein [Acidobacteriaceae bacterium]